MIRDWEIVKKVLQEVQDLLPGDLSGVQYVNMEALFGNATKADRRGTVKWRRARQLLDPLAP